MNDDHQLPFSITTAKKLLGKSARDFSDKEIEQQILLAEMLKDIFFTSHIYQKVEVRKGGKK